jgi:hypothetical protein
MFSAVDFGLPSTSVSRDSFQQSRAVAAQIERQRNWPPAPRRASLSAEIDLSGSAIDDIAALGTNWDGYGAPSIPPQICASAKLLLETVLAEVPLPEITPNSNGTISLEWEGARGVAHIELGLDTFSFFLKKTGSQPIYVQDDIGNLSHQALGALIHQRLFTIAYESILISDFRFATNVQSS